MVIEAELVADVRAAVGEGPLWDPDARALWWIDIPPGVLHRYDARSGASTSTTHGHALAAIAPRARGGWVAATLEGFATLDGPDETLHIVAGVEDDPVPSRMNDAACDARGRFWAGRTPLDLRAHPRSGSLWRLDPDGQATRVLDDLSLPNGIGWSPDLATMYVVDSTRFRIETYDYDAGSGEIVPKDSPFTFPERWEPLVLPDGLAVDDDGCLWVAFWGGGNVLRLSPDGEFLAEVRLPVSLVTSCAFGGEALDELYITTAHTEGEPGSGGLWRARPGVRGSLSHTFGG